VGITHINDDRSVTLLISEPPPHFTISELKKILGDYRFDVEEKTNKIGYDGWVKDVLVVISRIDQPGLNDVIKKLNTYLYSTDYKSYAIDLPVRYRRTINLPNLNYKLQVSELNKWFFEDKEKFYEQDNTTMEYSLADAFNDRLQGLLYSKTPGFVVWLLREQDDITHSENLIRRFCLDADLILGAVKSPEGLLAIIARERMNNLYDLPPLRAETIKSLASANKNEIAQSYERQTLFAGKIGGGMDWAPIYLSKELLNTEYGSLLNITDQMLKSWSSNGGIDYVDFSYPKPSYFAFDRSIRDVINTNTLTFNWNTKGVGYALDYGDYEVYCTNRTGSLPVTYIPEGLKTFDKSSVDKCEKRAYDYFSDLGNPDLARVVQYASLYQIFSRYQVTASAPTYPTNDETVPTNYILDSVASVSYSPGFYGGDAPASSLKAHAVDLIRKIKTGDESFFKQVVNRALSGRLSKLAGLEDRLTAFLFSLQDRLESYLSLFDSSPEDQFANVLVNMREFKAEDNIDQLKRLAAGEFLKSVKPFWAYILSDQNAESIRDEYVNNWNGFYSRWIKTPSVVVSWDNKDSAQWVGGHNLSARVTPFKISADVAPGRIKIVEENGLKQVLINAEDIASIDPTVLRKIAVDNENFTGTLAITERNYKPRSASDVFPDQSVRTERGLSSNHIRISAESTGFTINGKKVNDCAELVDELKQLAENNSFDNLQVHFEKIDADRAKALIKSSEIKLAGSELNRARIMSNGALFDITRKSYDFRNAKVISNLVDNEIVVEIPRLENIKSRARFTITGFLKDVKQNIVNTVNNLIGRGKNEDMNLYSEMLRELKQYNVSAGDILLEIDDCIICLKKGSTSDGAS
jgi:hypothetical protein